MAATPERNPERKRKADEITKDEIEGEIKERDEVKVNDSEEPASKKAKQDPVETVHKRWNADMEVPQGKPRPRFTGEYKKGRISGSGTVDDPLIVWLGKVPSNQEVRKANEDVVRGVALSLKIVTHVYIRCGTQSNKFIDRDGKRILLWNPDIIPFHHRTTTADPHMSVAFGTDPDNLVIQGYINVATDDNGKPTGLATSRNPDCVEDDDDRILELFPYGFYEQYCEPYCPTHAPNEVLLNACEYAWPKGCPHHDTEGLLDHYCRRPRWKTEPYGDHYCPCTHDLSGLLDHYCPCVHYQARRAATSHHCQHKLSKKDKKLHYCPAYLY
ncbi:hypothetical protein F5Y04DRAFT_282784 [Hypomontagnella monticulosa]|nr:hypothetical protein F5Y04DRAFT_282784 [Hypomontagnella monticulosa]